MKRPARFLLLAILLAGWIWGLPGSVASAAGREGSGPQKRRVWNLCDYGCQSGLHLQPDGPFAVLLFCEDALGDYLQVVRLGALGAPSDSLGRWTLENRVWRDALWGDDVTSFAWSPGGRRLYVATADPYGSGGLFELDLVLRRARQVAPARRVSVDGPGPSYVIVDLDRRRRALLYRMGIGSPPAGRKPETLSLRLPE